MSSVLNILIRGSVNKTEVITAKTSFAAIGTF
jgi:hypothetical protein